MVIKSYIRLMFNIKRVIKKIIILQISILKIRLNKLVSFGQYV